MDPDFEICWDENAFRSMQKTFNYLKRNASPTVAAKFRQSVFDAVDGLVQNPERFGYDRLLLEDPPRYRSVRLGTYRVVFEVKRESVFILLVYNSRQDPAKIRKMMP